MTVITLTTVGYEKFACSTHQGSCGPCSSDNGGGHTFLRCVSSVELVVEERAGYFEGRRAAIGRLTATTSCVLRQGRKAGRPRVRG